MRHPTPNPAPTDIAAPTDSHELDSSSDPLVMLKAAGFEFDLVHEGAGTSCAGCEPAEPLAA